MKEDLKDLKKWARGQVEEDLQHLTRKVPKFEQDYWEARCAYEKTFGTGFPSEGMSRSLEEMTALIWRCIEEGKPYKLNLPKGAII